jgi:hypothetical protein
LTISVWTALSQSSETTVGGWAIPGSPSVKRPGVGGFVALDQILEQSVGAGLGHPDLPVMSPGLAVERRPAKAPGGEWPKPVDDRRPDVAAGGYDLEEVGLALTTLRDEDREDVRAALVGRGREVEPRIGQTHDALVVGKHSERGRGNRLVDHASAARRRFGQTVDLHGEGLNEFAKLWPLPSRTPRKQRENLPRVSG